MDQVDQILKIIGAVLGIMAILFPVVAGWVMWQMSKRFATRSALRGAIRRIEARVEEKVQQVERDIERGNKAVMQAIHDSREATRVDINGLGDRIAGIQKVSELAMSRADSAHHAGELLRQRVESLDEHGTKKTAQLEQQILALTNNLALFNRLIEQGVLRASGPDRTDH